MPRFADELIDIDHIFTRTNFPLFFSLWLSNTNLLFNFWHLDRTVVVFDVVVDLVVEFVEIKDLVVNDFITIVDLLSRSISSAILPIGVDIPWLNNRKTTVSINQEGI